MADAQTEHQARVAMAASLLAVKDKDQKEIAQVLGVSQATVSRLLQEAVERGWLIRTLVYRPEKIPAEVRALVSEELDFKTLLDDLREKFGEACKLRAVRVFDSDWGGLPDTQLSADRKRPEMDRRLKIFGRSASPRLTELLKHVEIAGVSWGATLLHAVYGLEGTCKEPLRADSPIDFVPLCCEPLGNPEIQVSSTRIASRLNTIVNGGAGKTRSFTGVPAFIPKEFDAAARRTVERLIRHVDDYAEVFPPRFTKGNQGRSRPFYMCERLQLVLTSLAPADRLLGLSEDKLEGAGFDRKLLQKGAVGDLCGTVLKRRDASAKQKELIDLCNDSWTGIRLNELQQVPEETRGGHEAGIVVVAIGRSKVPVTLEAVRQGVHELLIDGDLATGLKDCLTDGSKRVKRGRRGGKPKH